MSWLDLLNKQLNNATIFDFETAGIHPGQPAFSLSYSGMDANAQSVTAFEYFSSTDIDSKFSYFSKNLVKNTAAQEVGNIANRGKLVVAAQELAKKISSPGHVAIGHNVTFDLNVLNETLLGGGTLREQAANKIKYVRPMMANIGSGVKLTPSYSSTARTAETNRKFVNAYGQYRSLWEQRLASNQGIVLDSQHIARLAAGMAQERGIMKSTDVFTGMKLDILGGLMGEGIQGHTSSGDIALTGKVFKRMSSMAEELYSGKVSGGTEQFFKRLSSLQPMQAHFTMAENLMNHARSIVVDNKIIRQTFLGKNGRTNSSVTGTLDSMKESVLNIYSQAPANNYQSLISGTPGKRTMYQDYGIERKDMSRLLDMYINKFTGQSADDIDKYILGFRDKSSTVIRNKFFTNSTHITPKAPSTSHSLVEAFKNKSVRKTALIAGGAILAAAILMGAPEEKKHNSISGMHEGGMAASMRHETTDFGSPLNFKTFATSVAHNFVTEVKANKKWVLGAGIAGFYTGYQDGKAGSSPSLGSFAGAVALDMADDILIFGGAQLGRQMPWLEKAKPYLEHPYAKKAGVMFFGYSAGKLVGELFGSASNSIAGMPEQGMAPELRKQNTPFGSPWDGLKNFIQSGKTFQHLRESTAFKKSLYNAEIVERIGAGAYATVLKMKANFEGKDFFFARKVGMLEPQEVNALKDVGDFKAPTLYGTGHYTRDQIKYLNKEEGLNIRSEMGENRLWDWPYVDMEYINGKTLEELEFDNNMFKILNPDTRTNRRAWKKTNKFIQNTFKKATKLNEGKSLPWKNDDLHYGNILVTEPKNKKEFIILDWGQSSSNSSYNPISGKDDAYNTIEGLHPEGKLGKLGSWGKKQIQKFTPFGSGWRGIIGGSEDLWKYLLSKPSERYSVARTVFRDNLFTESYAAFTNNLNYFHEAWSPAYDKMMTLEAAGKHNVVLEKIGQRLKDLNLSITPEVARKGIIDVVEAAAVNDGSVLINTSVTKQLAKEKNVSHLKLLKSFIKHERVHSDEFAYYPSKFYHIEEATPVPDDWIKLYQNDYKGSVDMARAEFYAYDEQYKYDPDTFVKALSSPNDRRVSYFTDRYKNTKYTSSINPIPGTDDAYNIIEGLHEQGTAAILRKENTNFGSGYQGLQPSYNFAEDEYRYKSARASKLGTSDAELYQWMTEKDKGVSAYASASANAGTAFHQLHAAQGFANGTLYDAEKLVYTENAAGHIDEITDLGIGDIKTVNSGIYNSIMKTGPKPMHRAQVQYYLGATGSERGYITYVNRDKPKQQKTYTFDFNPYEYEQLVRKVDRVQARVEAGLAAGKIVKSNLPKTASLETLIEYDRNRPSPEEEAAKVEQYNKTFKEQMDVLRATPRGMPTQGSGFQRIEDRNKQKRERQMASTQGVGFQIYNQRIGHHIM